MLRKVRRRLRSLVAQPDVKANPVRAVWRRLRWRLNWRSSPDTSFTIRHWTRGLSIELPRTGAAAQIYYHTFSSPRLAQLLETTLTEGMHFLDIGAHVGEYSLLAASLVAPSGRVTAVEPQPGLASLIRTNARRNRLFNISVHAVALAGSDQRLPLASDPRSGGAWLASGQGMGDGFVECRSLTSFLGDITDTPLDLAKLDAGGMEASVLAGARARLQDGALPRLVYKLYHPDVVEGRFGAAGRVATPSGDGSIVTLLGELGYHQKLLDPEGSPVASMGDVMGRLGPAWYSVPILAVRSPDPERWMG